MSEIPGSPTPALAEILDRLVAKAAAEKPAAFADLATVAGLDPATDFVGASLREIDLRGEDLRGFDFSKADLTGADFRGANVTGVRFDGAIRIGTIGLPEPSTLSGTEQVIQPPKFDHREAKRLVVSGNIVPEGCVPSITRLFLGNSGVKDLKSLTGLVALKILTFPRARVSDLTPLESLVALRYLNFSGALVRDLRPLAGLRALRVLDCSFTWVDDLGPLAGLEALESLSCGFTRVGELGSLADLFGLTALNFSGTIVSDLGPHSPDETAI
jgi:uncharacterized protein YjbI with pentapeptide repeats